MSDCFDHALDAIDSMEYERDDGQSGGMHTPVHKNVSKWFDTGIEAKNIDGRAHIKVDGVWCKLNIPTFVRGGTLAVRHDFWIDKQHLYANNVKDYYAEAGALKWTRTNIKGTKMGDTRYAWNGTDYVPMSFPAWIDPETNLVSVPDNFYEQLIELCS